MHHLWRFGRLSRRCRILSSSLTAKLLNSTPILFILLLGYTKKIVSGSFSGQEICGSFPGFFHQAQEFSYRDNHKHTTHKQSTMPSRRLRGKAPEISLDQVQQRQKRAQRQAKRARVAAAAAAKASEAASDAAAAMLGLGSEKSVEKNDQKEETSSPKVFSQISSAINTNSPALPFTGSSGGGWIFTSGRIRVSSWAFPGSRGKTMASKCRRTNFPTVLVTVLVRVTAES